MDAVGTRGHFQKLASEEEMNRKDSVNTKQVIKHAVCMFQQVLNETEQPADIHICFCYIYNLLVKSSVFLRKIIYQLLPPGRGDMKICTASGGQIFMSP